MGEGSNDIVKGAKAAAEVTGLNTREIYYLVGIDAVPYKKKGRLLYFSRSSLLMALKP